MTHTTRIVTIRREARHRRERARLAGRGGGWRLPLVGAIVVSIVGTIGLTGIIGASALGVMSAGLPDPSELDGLGFAQATIVYDRAAKVELGRFEKQRRRVLGFDQIPKQILDATTAAEDRTFWDNAGIDIPALVSAAAENASGTGERGASTITQQLVRARLLPDDVVSAGADRYVRKVKEIIQSLRINERYPGETGKQQVVSAYLNEIFYGHGAYGVAAAAEIYFGVSDLSKLTIAQAALLAGLPKAPTSLDPYRFAEPDKKGRLVVPAGSPPVVRRDWVLGGIAATGRWTRLEEAELRAAMDEPVVLAGERPVRIPGGHFTWQVRRQLQAILGPDADLERGGYRVTTTLDWRAQRLAEKWLTATAIVPNVSRRSAERILDRSKIPSGDRAWIRALRGKDLHNGALVALDYRTGDVLAYVGSAGYARDNLASRRFEPKYDAAGDGARQPGSAWKPILYAAAFDAKQLSPGSLLLDVTTEFDRRQDWAPRDADQRERGPVLVRRALQYSLNIPAVRALQRVGNERVAKTAEKMGIRFAGGREAFLQSGLAGALGTVEVRPLDLTSAYGTIANGGVHLPPRMILEVKTADGRVVWKADEPVGTKAISPTAAYLVTDILAGNTDPAQNDIWAEKLQLRGPGGTKRRPAAAKTGTTNDARDLGTYGFLPPTKDGVGLVVGVWLGNSDHSYPRAARPATSLTAAAPMWRAFMRDYTRKWPVTSFKRPKGLIQARIDAWSGGRPGAWTRETTKEWFIRGTQPGSRKAIDKDGLLYRIGCGGWRVDPLKAELGPAAWRADVADWLRRAHRGVGVVGRHDSATAYFWGERSWGGPLIGSCYRPRENGGDRGDGGGQGDGGGDKKDKKKQPPPPEPTPAPTD
ncbi:MAG TPA: transglycosylase domain-containing protein [Candidatus Limnocylindrales bacterium]|jgi:peptidoglycan glycosyltransferase|nr:transglycosylase domain-containing protein [Candidatus Limnocylindrales bacterium]